MSLMEFDPIQEEKDLDKHLRSISTLLYMTYDRDAETTRKIVMTGFNALQDYENYLVQIREIKGIPSSVEDRIRLVALAKEKLPLFSMDPHKITSDNQPPAHEVAASAHQLEITFANFYVPTSLYNELAAGRGIEDIISTFVGILRDYESDVRRKSGNAHCLKNNSHSGRAMMAYAYELTEARRYRRPNALEKIKETGDYSILYGREGIQHEVKEKSVYKNFDEFAKQHLHSYTHGKRFSFPIPIRALFADVVPRIETPEVA